MSNELSTINRADSAPIDWNAVYSALSLNPREPRVQALVMACEKYGLDPILKHAIVIPGQQGGLYVTRDGLLHVAHRSGMLDGIESEELPETQTHYCAVATVYRKDMSRPFRFRGRFPKSKNHQFGPEMAEKVAMARALRFAFDIALCSVEERWDTPEGIAQATGAAPSQPEPGRTIAPDERRQIIAAMERYGNLARSLDFDMLGEKGNLSRKKMTDLLMEQVGIDAKEASADDWDMAAKSLKRYHADLLAKQKQNAPPTDADEGEILDAGDDPELRDPFPDPENGTAEDLFAEPNFSSDRLLDVPPAEEAHTSPYDPANDMRGPAQTKTSSRAGGSR